MIYLQDETMDNMKKTSHNIGFEVLRKSEDVVVLKRVLSSKRGRRREDERFLPKLSVHYFEAKEAERLQSLAAELNAKADKMIEDYSKKADEIFEKVTARLR